MTKLNRPRWRLTTRANCQAEATSAVPSTSVARTSSSIGNHGWTSKLNGLLGRGGGGDLPRDFATSPVEQADDQTLVGPARLPPAGPCPTASGRPRPSPGRASDRGTLRWLTTAKRTLPNPATRSPSRATTSRS